ncbi:adenylate/guanylate cyclase domain-containing protein [uncultured Tateyamaria sp.]|uniref:adenylate/guanylate cyclase domain-containing protein n=1 Tax=uncultured Tateyamaria sp. TaxID=455651 RepID=UPI002638D406|nr:adenylate/guanylate cyclase domain-containing protein [uncultured Tateyamaria sp.]
MYVTDEKYVLFADIVESVRLYEIDPNAISEAVNSLLGHLNEPAFSAQHKVEKVSGDGLILTTQTANHAVQIALDIADLMSRTKLGAGQDSIRMTTAIACGTFIVGDFDIYGNPINLAARLAGSGLPGEILLTDDVRRNLSAAFDRRLVDCGERYLRNIAEPVRVHALRSGSDDPLPLMIPEGALRPLIAVLPFRQVGVATSAYPLGEAFADAIITELSSLRGFGVLSRMSTSRVAASGDTQLEYIQTHLQAHYLISGHCAQQGDVMTARAEVTEVNTGLVVWSGRVSGSIVDMLDGAGPTLQLVERFVREVMRHEHARTLSRPLDTVANYTLLMAGVSMMHALNRDTFARSRTLLETLADRASRQSTPLAWLAKWHVMHVLQDLSDDPKADAQSALDLTRRAIDADPDNALAHAVQGFAHTNLLHDFEQGNAGYANALAANPSEPLAWLLRGALRTFTGDGKGAVTDTEEACRLSPADPHKYFFLALAAGAHLSADNNEQAIALAEASLRSNCRHLSTLRVKLTAEWRLGQIDAARNTTQQLMRIDPGFRLSDYKVTAAAAKFSIGAEVAQALKESGAPA